MAGGPAEELSVTRGSLLLTIAVAGLVAACGGSGPTQGPGVATQGPAAGSTDPGGGGGGSGGSGGGSGGGGTGTATYQVTGDVQKSGELPFFAFGSRFGGEAGVALNFTKEDGAILSIGEIAGEQIVALVDEAHGLNWTKCETFELRIDGTNASGRFDCSQGVGSVVADGSIVTNIHITGTFEAHG